MYQPITLWERLRASCAAFRWQWQQTEGLYRPTDEEMATRNERAALRARIEAQVKVALESLDVLDRAIILGISPSATPADMIRIIETLPDQEAQCRLAMLMTKRDHTLVGTKPFLDWACKNASFMARNLEL